MVSIALVVPSWHYWLDPTRLQPLYEMYYATILESYFHGKTVRVTIVDLRGIALDQQARHVAEHDAYIYWIMKSGDYAEIAGLIKELRKHYPSAKHVAGGTHVDMCADECAAVFDAVVTGPGEETLPIVIKDLLRRRLKKRYADSFNRIHYGKYPFMLRHFLPTTAIINYDLFGKYGKDIRATCVLFSRGCNFKCAYCVYNVPGKVQMKPLPMIAEEIEYLKKQYRVQAINLKDEIALPMSRRVCIPFLETIKRAKVMWRGQTTVWGATKEQLKLAGESGCVELAIGVESSSELVREIVNKRIKDNQIKSFIDTCHQYGIKIKMCLILGLPGEPRNIVSKTIQFIEKMRPDYGSVSGFDPFPGSPIYNNMKEYGIKYVDSDWGKHAHLLFRFSNKEDVGLPFEYEKQNKWGKTFTKQQIVDNICAVQNYLRENGMTY